MSAKSIPELQIEYIPVDNLEPYEKNARKHRDIDVKAIANSIREFGFDDPIGIWSDKNIIVEGHGRLMAAKSLGLSVVPCVRLDHLTDEQRKAYALAHNRTAELSAWDLDVLNLELDDILDIDMSDFGFDGLPEQQDWFETHERGDTSRQEGNEEYNAFLDKFEQAKTTDDCYTPDIVYDAVADWVSERYGYERSQMVRPFYPGGNYQKEKYPDGCVVVDNPPFSILSEIRKWYADNGIKYFLFAPSLSCCAGNKAHDCAVTANVGVTYENKAQVPTSFVTNLEPDYVIITAPDLRKKVQDAADEYAKQLTRPIPKYSYPKYVITAAMGGYLSKYGQDIKIKKEDAYLIKELDMQKEQGKAIYGGGYLLSEKAAAENAAAEKAAAENAAAEKAAAEKAAAEKAAATVWKLSDRERAIVKRLGK